VESLAVCNPDPTDHSFKEKREHDYDISLEKAQINSECLKTKVININYEQKPFSGGANIRHIEKNRVCFSTLLCLLERAQGFY
jgi:hypothetical protein